MKSIGKSLPPKQTEEVRTCYLQRWFKDPTFFLLKTAGAGHGAAPRQIVWIRGGLAVEDVPTTLTGRPRPEPRRDLDTYILPTPAGPDQKWATWSRTEGTSPSEGLLLYSTHSFLHGDQGEGRGARPGLPPGLCAERQKLRSRSHADVWRGWLRALVWTFAPSVRPLLHLLRRFKMLHEFWTVLHL